MGFLMHLPPQESGGRDVIGGRRWCEVVPILLALASRSKRSWQDPPKSTTAPGPFLHRPSRGLAVAPSEIIPAERHQVTHLLMPTPHPHSHSSALRYYAVPCNPTPGVKLSRRLLLGTGRALWVTPSLETCQGAGAILIRYQT